MKPKPAQISFCSLKQSLSDHKLSQAMRMHKKIGSTFCFLRKYCGHTYLFKLSAFTNIQHILRCIYTPLSNIVNIDM